MASGKLGSQKRFTAQRGGELGAFHGKHELLAFLRQGCGNKCFGAGTVQEGQIPCSVAVHAVGHVGGGEEVSLHAVPADHMVAHALDTLSVVFIILFQAHGTFVVFELHAWNHPTTQDNNEKCVGF